MVPLRRSHMLSLAASSKSVRGGHPPRLRMDEVDKMDLDIGHHGRWQLVHRVPLSSRLPRFAAPRLLEHGFKSPMLMWHLAEVDVQGRQGESLPSKQDAEGSIPFSRSSLALSVRVGPFSDSVSRLLAVIPLRFLRRASPRR